jgi:CRISPR system Cascade subunit CasC
VTCLNRDDVGAPKSARFGGVQRARVSSQCWKRAIRALASDGKPASMRGHYIASKLADKLAALGVDEAQAKSAAETVIDSIAGTDKKGKDEHKASVALFLTDGELAAIAVGVKTQLADGKKLDPKKGDLAKLIKAASVKDAADIAIFGRMVADDHTLTMEGAGLFSHALSTHATANELDFFSAVDDTRQDADDAGAGHIGTLEFNSACYYRYVGLNLDLLKQHLAHYTPAELRSVLDGFLRAAVLAVPNARKNSMFGFNPPSYVLALRRSGQPLSLANAFERPVSGGRDGGYVKASEEALAAHWTGVKGLYSLKCDAEAALPPKTLDDLVATLLGDAL